jgi:hypothetical protein
MEFIANAHVRETGARLTEPIEAPNIRRATAIAQEWASENALTCNGVETAAEHEERMHRAEARTHVPPAGGMTRDEVMDVYHDNPGKLHSMLGELD